MINMVMSKKQKMAMDMIDVLGEKFGDKRWFTKYELPGITQHSMDALVRKGFLVYDADGPVVYYRQAKCAGDES